MIKLNNSINWLYELKPNLLKFLETMQIEKGFYRYSLTGDIYNHNIHWGLGNTIFAIRLLKMIDSLNHKNLENAYNFIVSFQKENGYIYDSFLHKKALFYNFLSTVKNFDFRNLNRKKEKLAESRQAFSLLFSIGKKPPIPFFNFPRTHDSIDKFLASFNWKKPWGAGSHFSHLIFFLFNMKKHYPEHFDYNSSDLISFTINSIQKLQRNDGCWYKGNTTLREKINGAMKIITGFNIVNHKIKEPKRLIDLALEATNDQHACDNFNIIYVLFNCLKQLNYNYRQDEIIGFFLDRLKIYKKHYFEKYGGFSFYPKKTNVYYYKARITRGLNEPDIHGTLMFTWGISLIIEALKKDKKIGIASFNP